MPSKSFSALVFLLALTSSVNAQAAVSPALGVRGEPAGADVRTPSIPGDVCGGVDIAVNIDISRIVQVDVDDLILSVDIINFNLGVKGSRFIQTVGVDASGTGEDLVAAKIIDNGDAAPANLGSQTITVQLPIDIQCHGGRGANLCIASFITTSGYGNCVVFTLIDVHTDDERKRGDKARGITAGKRESVDVDGVVQVDVHRRGIERRRSSYRNGNI